MFSTIKIDGEKIACNKRFDIIKGKIEDIERHHKGFFNDAKMECRSLVEGANSEYSISVSSLLIAFASLFVMMYQDEKSSMPVILGFIPFIIGMIGIMVFSINMGMKKQDAVKILMIIQQIEKERNEEITNISEEHEVKEEHWCNLKEVVIKF